MIFLHFKYGEHMKLQEEYGKEKGTEIGRLYARTSSLEFIFWMGLYISPQPTPIIARAPAMLPLKDFM